MRMDPLRANVASARTSPPGEARKSEKGLGILARGKVPTRD